MTTETRRFTGFRIRLAKPEEQLYAWADLRQKLMALTGVIEVALHEPYFIDDILRGLAPLDLLAYGLQEGELFVHLFEGKFAGLIILREIIPNRSAVMEAWAHPDFRSSFKHRKVLSKFAKDVIKYAFRDFSHGNISTDGLGLKKLKAEVSALNRPAICAARALGFQMTGASRLDAFFNSIPSDMFHLELLNPAFFRQSIAEVMPSVQEQSVNSNTDAGIRSTGTIPSTAAAPSGGSDGAKPARRNQAGQRGGSATAVIPTAKKRPVRSGAKKSA